MKIKENKNWITLILMAILTGIVITVVSYNLPIKQQSFNTLYIDRRTEYTNSKYFTYDGLYSQQTAERFTDTIKSLAENEDIVGITLKNANFLNTKKNRKEFLKHLKIKKTGPQVLFIELDGIYYTLLDDLLDTLGNYMKNINKSTEKGIVMQKISRSSTVEEKSNYPILNGVVASLLVIFIGGIVLERKKLLKLI